MMKNTSLIEHIKSNPYFIAEIGVNHNGDMNLAKKMIIAAKKSGANAVKFQTFKAKTLVTPKTPKVKYQKTTTNKKETHYEMIEKLELNKENHVLLKNFCKKKNIEFLSTPYDASSAVFLSKLGCKIFKTASADIVDLEMHEYLAKNKKIVIISTGMSELNEIDNCLNIYKKNNNKNYILMHCVSNYPCSNHSLNLRALDLLKEKYKCPVGFSDHSIGNKASILSYTLGAKVFEKHFTTNKSLKGPDQKASVLPKDFSRLVKDIYDTEIYLGKKIKTCQKEEIQMRSVSRKSLTLINNLKSGDVIKKTDLSLKRPGTGLLFKDIKKILGKRVKYNLNINYQIKIKDII